MIRSSANYAANPRAIAFEQTPHHLRISSLPTKRKEDFSTQTNPITGEPLGPEPEIDPEALKRAKDATPVRETLEISPAGRIKRRKGRQGC